MFWTSIAEMALLFAGILGLAIRLDQLRHRLEQTLERRYCGSCQGVITDPHPMIVMDHVELLFPARTIPVRFYICNSCQGINDAALNA